MAVLSPERRAAVAAKFMQEATGPLTILKNDVQACVNGLDDYYNVHAVDINQALPLPGRTQLTNADKALMNNLVVEERYVSGA